MKVLHLPDPVGGYAWGLAQGEKKIGLSSKVLIKGQNWLNYPYDFCLWKEKDSKFIKVLKCIKAFFRINGKYNVYHFNFGSTLIDFPSYGIHLIDLPYYKGVKIMAFNGCDVRQKYLTIKRTKFSACHEDNCYDGICNSGERDKIRKKRVSIVSKYVDHIFAVNPDLLHFLPREKSTFLPYAISSWYNLNTPAYSIDKKIKILHAPTNKGAKGSMYILNALERLKQRYKNLDVILVEGVANNEALIMYTQAHLIIDQVLIGWYGGLAVEAMKLGKPVAVFIREEDLEFIPKEMANQLKEAIININPYNIEEVLSLYIENPNLLIQKSKASLEYVNKWHNPVYVASITKSVYEKFINNK